MAQQLWPTYRGGGEHDRCVGGDTQGLLSRLVDADLIGLDLDLVPRGQEGVEANDEVGVTFEQVGDPVYNARRVDSVEYRDKIKILFNMGLK